jgi:hypothetical protein
VSHDGKQTPLHEIPRFKELIEEKNMFKTAKDALEHELNAAKAEKAKLVEMLGAYEKDVDTVKKISVLANTSKDERVQTAIDTLEKALNNKLEEAVEEAKAQVSEGTITLDEAKKMVTNVQSDLEAQLRQQSEAMVYDRARNVASKWLSNLPEEYAAEDVKAVDEFFHNRVDWDSILSEPDQMDAVLYKAFESALEFYGEPRGALLSKTIDTETGEPKETKATITPESALDKLKAVNWGEVKDGKTVYSDEDFSKAAGDALRLAKQIAKKG